MNKQHSLDELRLLLRLSQIPRLGANTIGRILAEIDIAELAHYEVPDWQLLGLNETQISAWFNPKLEYIEPALTWLQQAGNHIIGYSSPHYPFLLKQISSPPPLLFVQGQIELLSQPQIAIVGSRYCSHYGGHWAKFFAQQLALAGFAITSGMALGIDGHCHRACLDVGGQTIAVLGSGLNHLYPKSHRSLAQQIIAQQGVVVSEFLPNTPPKVENFPRRNRIISGLSIATLVIEASEKSGSLITARYALEQNRELFALPGNIQSEFSRGCHKLIKQGAMLVESAQDILENIGFSPFYSSSHSENMLTKKDIPPTTAPAVKPQYPDLYHKIGIQKLNIDDLLDLTKLEIGELLAQLIVLESQGLISQQGGMYYRNE